MRRRLIIGAAICAGLVALYAGAGNWLAPSLVRDTLVEHARQAGLDLRVEKVSTHPFALSVELHDVRLSTAEGKRILYVQRAAADLAAASLFQRHWIVQSVALERPVLSAFPATGRGDGERTSLPAIEVREAWLAHGVLDVRGLPRLENVSLTAHSLSTTQGDAGTYEAVATLAGGGKLSSQGRAALAPLDAQGAVRLEDAALGAAWHFLPDRFGAAPPGALDASLGFRFRGGRLALSDFRASARLESGAKLSASGAIGVQPFSANLLLDGERLPLRLLQPLLPQGASFTVEAGTLSGRGRLHLGGERPRYEGAVAVHEARVEDGAGALLLESGLSTDTLALQFSPFALHADEIVAREPHGRLAIDEKGRLNFARAFAADAKGADAPRPDIRVARLRIAGGRLDFTDRSLPSPFGTTVHELSGTVSGLSTAPDQAARVSLDGRVGKYGDARVRGTVELTAPSTLTSLRARLRNLALPDFTPYAVKFAGYRIESGRLDAELRYRVKQGQLVGSNQLVFQHLELGEKVESASALDLPVELAVALLSDSQGRIDLAIPVTGNLRDPHFDIGGLVAKALGNTLRKVVAAPFRLLASLFGHGGEEAPEAVAFDAGSAQMAPPEEETAATLARALADRPQLELAIHPGYDAEADGAALKRAALLRRLAAGAGRESAAAGATAPADAADPKIAAAAEALLRSRGASAADLAALEPKKPGYGRRLIERLAPAVELEPYAIERLAQERARAVQRMLIEHGAPADRVAIDSAGEAKAGGDGVPTSFELRRNRSSRP